MGETVKLLLTSEEGSKVSSTPEDVGSILGLAIWIYVGGSKFKTAN